MARYNVKSARVDDSPHRERLLQLGEDEATACVIASLLDNGPQFVNELHKDTGYSTASVVNVLHDLEQRGWVDATEVDNGKRGRNPKKYSLSVSKTKLKQHYKEIFDKRLEAVENAVAA